jgi:hypothetical protein
MSLALEIVGSGLKDSIGSILNQLEWASFGHTLGSREMDLTMGDY